ncbi:unnamed protein product, partial [Allacma fusca]
SGDVHDSAWDSQFSRRINVLDLMSASNCSAPTSWHTRIIHPSIIWHSVPSGLG